MFLVDPTPILNATIETFKQSIVDHQKHFAEVLERLKTAPNKDFQVIVGDKTYNMFYEILEGSIDVFVHNPESSEADLVKPTLRLNIGAFLLPESMDLDGVETQYNPEAYNDLVKEISGTKSLPQKELDEIMSYLNKIGLLNYLIKHIKV